MPAAPCSWPSKSSSPSIEDQFVERLRAAKSNLPEHGDGAHHLREVGAVPRAWTSGKLAGHYAISSLFETLWGQDQDLLL